MTVLLPGDVLDSEMRVSQVGPGLRFRPTKSSATRDVALATHAGLLSSKKSNVPYLEYSSKRYIPAQGDSVIAQITARYGEVYRVDIGSSVPATLDHLAFYNVNRKNKPNLQVGNLVYARVSGGEVAGMEAELSCITAENKAGDYGPLDTTSATGPDGLSFLLKSMPLHMCRRLLGKGDATLQIIGEAVGYEVVVGMNGRIWIAADERGQIVRLVSIFEAISEGRLATEVQVRQFVKDVFRK